MQTDRERHQGLSVISALRASEATAGADGDRLGSTRRANLDSASLVLSGYMFVKWNIDTAEDVQKPTGHRGSEVRDPRFLCVQRQLITPTEVDVSVGGIRRNL